MSMNILLVGNEVIAEAFPSGIDAMLDCGRSGDESEDEKVITSGCQLASSFLVDF